MSKNMAEDPKFDKAFEKTFDIASLLAKAAVVATDSAPASVCMAMAVVAGGLSVLAQLISAEEYESGTETTDHYVFGALLAANSFTPNGRDGVEIQFDPSVILDTMRAFEKLTERNADKFLAASMAGAAREMEEAGNDALDAFMATRPAKGATA